MISSSISLRALKALLALEFDQTDIVSREAEEFAGLFSEVYPGIVVCFQHADICITIMTFHGYDLDLMADELG